MEYTVSALARLAGVSGRTLRYYDQIGLLRPRRISSGGYRIYGGAEVDRLQQILLYRELGLSLEEIAALMDRPDTDPAAAMERHLEALCRERERLDRLIDTVERTIGEWRGAGRMRDSEKFAGLKRRMIEDNERQYGGEIRKKYGDQAVDLSHRRLMDATREEMQEMEQLTQDLADALRAAVAEGDPAGTLGRRTAELHKQWLSLYWTEYTPEAHVAVAQLYVDDPRFTDYYENIVPGGAKFLRDAVEAFCG